jgi:hypothetical protein
MGRCCSCSFFKASFRLSPGVGADSSGCHVAKQRGISRVNGCPLLCLASLATMGLHWKPNQRYSNRSTPR